MAFWQEAKLEPKRAFRFELSVAGLDTTIPKFLISKVNKPSFSISESEHKYLNHTFYYPGRMSWNDISFTIVDVISHTSDGTQAVMKMLEKAGYKIPTNEGETSTLSKARSVGALGKVIIRQIDSDGGKVEEWVLNNAWIKEAKFGDLDYGSEDMMNIEISLKYDNAYVNAYSKKLPSNAGGAN